MEVQRANQSNPFSTGGGGVNYEESVQTYYAACMLMGTRIPHLQTKEIVKIKLQGRYEGFDTDDCIIYGKDGRKLLCQIKHSITISEKNTIFNEVIESAWNDYLRESFDSSQDQLLLIVNGLSATDRENTTPLFRWARTSISGEEFVQKVNLEGFSSNEKKRKYNVIVNILNRLNKTECSIDKIWGFFSHFSIQDMDLDNPDTPFYLLFSESLKRFVGREDFAASLYRFIADYNQNAGTVTKDKIIEYFGLDDKAKNTTEYLEATIYHNNVVKAGMHDSICGITIPRNNAVENLETDTRNNDVVLVTGQRGVGKTGVVRQYVAQKSECQVLLFRAEELNEFSMRNVLSNICPNMSLRTMNDLFLGCQECFIIIESLERVLENEHQGAFCELLDYVGKRAGWKIIATIRDYAVNQIIMNFLSSYPLNYTEERIDVLADEEVEFLLKEAKILENESINSEVRQLAKIPVFLDLIIRSVKRGYSLSAKDNKNTIIEAIWSTLIANNMDRRQALPERRKNTFTGIAVERAKTSMYMVSEEKYDLEILNLLESDSLIIRANGMIAIAHDVLEDIALEKWIELTYSKSRSFTDFFNQIGFEQTICRAYRLWLTEKLKNEQYALDYFSRLFTESINAEFNQIWLDETIAALLTNDSLEIVLNNLASMLLHNETILVKILFMMRVVSKRPDESLKNIMGNRKPTEQSSFIILRPHGKCWKELFAFLEKNKVELSNNSMIVNQVIQLLIDWKKGITIQNDKVEGARHAGLLSLYYLKKSAEEKYYNKKLLQQLFEVAIVSVGSISDEFKDFIEETILDDSKRQEVSYIDALAEFLLTNFSCCYIAKNSPQILMDVAKKEWLFSEQKEWGNRRLCRAHNNDMVYATGFCYSSDFSYDQPSGLREPFRSLFAHNPQLAIQFLSDLCNHMVVSLNNYISEHDEATPLNKISFSLSNGKVVEQYFSNDLWVAYRGFSRVVPEVLQCGLMALENCLIECFSYEDLNSFTFESFMNKTMELSNSVLTTAVLASIGIAYEKRLGIALIPILEKIDCLNMDSFRCANEIQASFMLPIPFPNEQWFTDERKKANGYSWRNNCLDSLFVKYQFSEYRSRLLESIDSYSKGKNDSEQWTLRKRKIDTREFIVENQLDDKTFVLTSKPLEGDLQRNEQQNNLLARYQQVQKWEEKERDSEVQEDAFKSEHVTFVKELKELYDSLQYPGNGFLDLYAQSIMNTMGIILIKYRDCLETEEISWLSECLLHFLSDKLDSDKLLLNSSPTGLPFLIGLIPHFYDIWGAQTIKELLAKYIGSGVKEISAAAAKAISRSLWNIDQKLSEELLQIIVLVDDYYVEANIRVKRQRRFFGGDKNRLDNLTEFINKRNIPSQDLVQSKVHSIVGTSLLLSAVPASAFNEFKDIICAGIHKIIEVAKKVDNYREERDYDANHFYDYNVIICDALGYIFYNCSEEELYCIKNDISKLALEAPRVMKWVLNRYKLYCEKDRRFEYYWSFYRLLNDTMVTIANNLNHGENYLYHKQSEVLSNYCYTDCNWQPLDYKNRPIEAGCDDICFFSKKVLNNPIVYTGIASLMYHFPDLMLKKGIDIHDMISVEELVANFNRDSNSIFYMENNMHAFITRLDGKIIDYYSYSACIKILNALIIVASSKAYYLRDFLIKSKRIGMIDSELAGTLIVLD